MYCGSAISGVVKRFSIVSTLLYSEAALSRAQVSEAEAVHIRRSCASKREPRENQYKVLMARAIDNLEVDRPQRKILQKRRKRGKGKLLKLQGMASREQGLMAGWAGGVAR